MADKDNRISFRLDSVRSSKMATYRNDHKINNKKITKTQFMLLAIDHLLEGQNSETKKEIEQYEAMIIKIMVGINKNDFEDQQEYLKQLKEKIEKIKMITERD